MKTLLALLLLGITPAKADLSNPAVMIYDSADNGLTSQVNGSQRALDIGINVSGTQVDPRTRTWTLGSSDAMATFLDKTGSGTIGALNAAVTFTPNGMSTAVISVVGTFSAILQVEGQAGDGIWNPVLGYVPGNGNMSTVFVSPIALVFPIGGYSSVRVRASSYTSGSATVTYNLGSGDQGFQAFNLIPASLQAMVQGTVASGATDSGNGIKVSGVYNTTVPAITTGQRSDLQTDSRGALVTTYLDGFRASYSACATSFTPAATPTDVFTLTGSASKTVRLLKVTIGATQTTAAVRDVVLLKRSAANTGGTSAAATAVSHDSTNAAATATALSYTVNPAGLGALVGNLRVQKLAIPVTGASTLTPLEWDFGTTADQSVTLRGTAQVASVNLNSVSSAGNLFDICMEWTEE